LKTNDFLVKDVNIYTCMKKIVLVIGLTAAMLLITGCVTETRTVYVPANSSQPVTVVEQPAPVIVAPTPVYVGLPLIYVGPRWHRRW
jgi:hypothetical protein